MAAACLALGSDALISHESALALLDLSDVIPDAIHIVVPRSRRYRPALPGVRLHTTTRPLARGEITPSAKAFA
jgi:predicted transcriptional regulator of viral defense system